MPSQPPFRPEHLAGPPMEGPAFVDFLKAEKQRKYPEPPAFYQALYDGQVEREDLQLWVKDLYHYWDYGVVYSTGAIFIKNNDPETRQQILRRMVDIEGEAVVNDMTGWTTPSWEELWLQFGEAIGVSRQEVQEWRPFTRTHFSISTLCTYSRYWDWSWLDGIGTLYAFDLHTRECMSRAEEALRVKCGVPEEGLKFFRTILEDVDTQIPWEERALAYWCCTTERQLSAARAFRERLGIENQLLVAIEQARTQATLPFQVPRKVAANA